MIHPISSAKVLLTHSAALAEYGHSIESIDSVIAASAAAELAKLANWLFD